jgi:hypothetical protein
MFRIGDRVRVKEGSRECFHCSTPLNLVGFEGIICDLFTFLSIPCYGVNFGKDIRGHDCSGNCPDLFGQRFCENHLELVDENSNKQQENKMSKLNNMMKRLLDEPTKKLIKAGYINGDLLLTNEGEEALKAIVFEEKKEALVKMAEEKIAEEKED